MIFFGMNGCCQGYISVISTEKIRQCWHLPQDYLIHPVVSPMPASNVASSYSLIPALLRLYSIIYIHSSQFSTPQGKPFSPPTLATYFQLLHYASAFL